MLEAGNGNGVLDVDFQGSFKCRQALTLTLTLFLPLALTLGGEVQRLDCLPEKYSKQRLECDEQSSRVVP